MRGASGAESVNNMATAAPTCSLENYLVLPDNTMDDRIPAARKILGRECVILGHHYQRDEVIRFADFAATRTNFRSRRRKREGSILSSAACISWRRAPTFRAMPAK